jgi:hypothetical protein
LKKRKKRVSISVRQNNASDSLSVFIIIIPLVFSLFSFPFFVRVVGAVCCSSRVSPDLVKIDLTRNKDRALVYSGGEEKTAKHLLVLEEKCVHTN